MEHRRLGNSGLMVPALTLGTVTFGGVRYVGKLNAYTYNPNDPNQVPGVTTRTYADPSFNFTADENSISSGAPEPASWALMLGGFGLAGAALRRRRAKAALA